MTTTRVDAIRHIEERLGVDGSADLASKVFLWLRSRGLVEWYEPAGYVFQPDLDFATIAGALLEADGRSRRRNHADQLYQHLVSVVCAARPIDIRDGRPVYHPAVVSARELLDHLRV